MLQWLAAVALAAGPLQDGLAQEAAPAAAGPKLRNVLFYLIDTCRADHLSVGGYARPTTPFLEEFAARGVVFKNCFSQAPWTKPSMSAILTSCYPSVTGMHKLLDYLDNRFVTMPEAFKAAGYYTAGFSANPLMGRWSNYTQGFRRFTEATQVIPGGDPIKHAGGSAKALNTKVLPWLGQNDQWPLFLYVHSIDPHEEYEPAAEYLELFADPAGEAEYRRQWKALLDVKPNHVANHCTQEHFELADVSVEDFIGYGRSLYDANIRANDHELSRLIDALRDRDVLDETLIVVTADHGEEFMEHGGTSHAFMLWNELIHVPLMLIAPGLLPEGLVVEEAVQSLDIYPTLLELLGLPAQEGLQGRSFAQLLRGEPGDGRAIFSENHEMPGSEQFFFQQGNTLSVIRGPWKLILNLKSPYNRPRPRRELYRIDEDFAEKTDLAEAKPELAEELEQIVLEWWAACRAKREGVDVKDLTVEALMEADPETLERLRKLGYVK